MALTPEDVLNKTFTQTQFRRGYDEREVDDFLDEVVAEMRRLVKDSDDLRAQVEELQQVNRQLQESSKAQYLDTDNRLNRLESGAPAAARGSDSRPRSRSRFSACEAADRAGSGSAS